MSSYFLSRALFMQQLSRFRVRVRLLCVVGAPWLLSGCVTFSPDGGMSVVANVAGHELRKDVVAIRTPQEAEQASDAVRSFLRRPLTADTAVQIALLNNRGLQAAYNELGIAEANRVQASLPPNPTVSVGRLSGPAEIEIEKRIVANILSLATLPARAEIATQRFSQAQLRAAEDTLRLAADTRRTYYRAVAQRQLAAFLAQAQSAAETATQLARRLGETGAMNKLDQARDQVFYAELTAQLATARQRATSERERLTRLLGLWGADANLKLPSTLAALPRRPLALPDIEVEAIRRRVDLQIARIEVDLMARSYGLGQATRFINLLEVAGVSKTKKERETGERVRDDGFELEFQIPIFDLGEVRVRQAEHSYMQAVNRLTEKAVNVRSEARDAFRAYRSTYDIAAHYRREIIPLRKIISDETLLRYNAMMIDVFALLAEARQRINSNVAAIEAQRDFWLASVDLATAVTGGGVAGGGGATTAVAAGGEPAGH
ncbi:outer membrane protein TolC [Pseudorhodoplanes sinuspersici]|uniref:Copper resistance protein n=2 Tax=Pseudorhodoplanes sinuspersici TaxID=1235591 RepID=A0A1W6ZLR8_9HYPH|nr:TolC family protein [Pseudorhodoplanes sinuspersici]ARP98060.1 copper resistance protein [Pseudorhodoplanes sinuspersici]RKE68187.1 outer membrane protein TolC [Pseudorhodoplanes sinuspersici]